MPKLVTLGYDPNEAFQDDDESSFQTIAGFSSGIKQTQALLGGGLPALVQSAIGDEEDAIEYLDYYNKKMEEAAEIGGDFQRLEDIDGAGDAVQWLTYTLGQALPSIGTSVLSGGFGGAAVQYGAKKLIANTVENQVKQKAGKAFEKAMVKRELNRRTQKARKFGQIGGAVAASTGMNAGETFANVYEESGGIQDPALALATGLAAGSLDALAPLSILKKVLPDNMSEPFKEMMADRLLRNKGMVKRAFIEGVRTGGIEGATEAAQEVLQAAAVGMFNDPQSGYKSYGESFFQALTDPTEQQRSQYLNAFAAGVVGGGGMGGVSGAFYKPRSAPEKSPMPDSEGNMPVETPQSEELEAQQAGFDSYSDYLDAYEGMATMNRTVSIEAIQSVIPDQFYMGQDMTPEQDAEYEAETERLRQEFNPKLDDLVGQVVGQGEAEGVLRRREDGTFFVRDFDSGEEVSIKTRKSGGDQSATDVGVERRNNEVELERDSRVRFNPEDSTFTSPDRGEKPFKYIRTNYGQDGEVESVTAEVMEGATAGEERVFQKRMASQIESARIQAEGATALQETRGTLSRGRTQADIEGNLSSRADEGVPETMLDPPVPQQPQQQQPQAPTQAAQQPAVMTDMAEVDIADRVATSLASALGDVIRAVTNPQAQTQQQAPQPSSPARADGANQGRVIEAGNTRAVIDTDSPQAADTLQRQFSDTEDRRQQQLRDLDSSIESARQANDGRMGAADVQNMLDNRMGASDIQERLEADDRMGASDVQGMLEADDRMGASDIQARLEADDRMGAQDVRTMLEDDTPMMRRDSAPRGATRRPVVTDEELNTVIDRVVGGNQEARSLINIVDRFDQLPAELQEVARQQGSDGSDVDAVSHNGQIYIVKGRMRSPSRLERALLHEGTHGGINQMFADVGVSRALNAMFNAMGGQKGFDRIVDELGIREQLKTYEQGTREAKYSKETRNYIMVSEMLAYTGEAGGKTLKSRIREVIGAIRDWFRRNGFAKLSTMRASDIALIAKNAREDYFRNDQARQDGQPLFSRVRDRAQKDFMGLYSNAEQTLLDEGGKIFKPSKKNPEAMVRGDQIFSFLKARGLKKEEANYTKIEKFLTDTFSRDVREEALQFYTLRLEQSVAEEVVQDGMSPAEAMAARANGLSERIRSYLEQAERDESLENRDPNESFQEGISRRDRKNLARMLLRNVPTDIDPNSETISMDFTRHMESIRELLNKTLMPVEWVANMSGKPADRFTRDEVIDYLREYAPDLDETVEVGLGEDYEGSEVEIANETVLDDSIYYEHYWDDYNYSMRNNQWEEFGPELILNRLLEMKPSAISDLIRADIGQVPEDFSPTGIAQAYADKDVDLYQSLEAEFESELDEINWNVSEQIYLDDPYYEYEVYIGEQLIGEVSGNEGIGFRLTARGKDIADSEVYSLEEASVRFQQYAMEEGLMRDSGETRWFSHLKIDPKDVVEYREKVITLDDNRLAPDKKFTGGHFDVDNMLFAVLMTERKTDLGKALAIEEMQSDWHSQIRSAGNPFSEEAVQQSIVEQEVSDRVNTKNANSAMDALAAVQESSGIEAIRQGDLEKLVDNVYKFDQEIRPMLTERGLFTFLTAMESARMEGRSKNYEVQKGWGALRNDTIRMQSGYFNFNFQDEALMDAALDILDEVGDTPIADYNQNFYKLYGQDPTSFRETEESKLIAQRIKDAGKALETWGASNRSLMSAESKTRQLRSAPPNSPFRNDQYLDLGVKGVIRDAVMEGADIVMLSKADRVQNRWSQRFDYEAIYNGKTKKQFEKITGSPAQELTADNKLVKDGERKLNGFWAFKITDELREQVKADGMPMFRRITNQTNSHEDAANKGELLNGQPANNEFNLHDETRGELWLRTIQDKYLPLKKFEEASAKFLGLKELPDELSGYVGETLHSGKQKRDMDDLERDYVAPLAEVMKENEIDVDDLGLYLIARHAEERNNYIAEINPEMPEGGSGMSTEDAKRLIGEMESAAMNQAAQIVYDMLAANRKRMKDFGLVDEDTVDAWQDRYQFYVPLKGFATSKDGETYIPPRGNVPKGFNLSGKEAFKALGRQSQAENPVLFAIADSEQKIVRSRRAEPARQFLALADEVSGAGSDQLTVYRPEDAYPMNPRATDARGNVIQQRMKAPDMRIAKRKNGDPRFLTVKEDGYEVFIEVKNDALNRVMQQLDADDMSSANGLMKSLTDKMRTFQNFRRNMLINWNPSWFVINPFRDLQTGLMYSLAEESKAGGLTEGENLTSEILRRYIPATRAYWKNIRGGKADNEYDAYYDEYTKAGAPTGLTLTKDIEEQRDALFAMVTDGPLTAKGKRGLRFVEDLNTSSENAIRFATYVSAREAGVSVQKSANLAKNLTVNFNRKGEISDGLNLLYLFFNAAVQGTANIAQALNPKSRTADRNLTKAQIGAASIALIAYMVTEYNLNAADEDDDGESLYNDLSDYDHLMSWNIVLGDGKSFAQIPMPYGYGFFHTLGRVGAEYLNETKDEADVAAEITASFAHHMLPPPLAFVGTAARADDFGEVAALAAGSLAPTITEPVVAFATNRNFFGAPIYIEDNPLIKPPTPDSNRSKRSTGEHYKFVAELLNDVTGGSEYRSGWADLSPDGMQYVQEYLFGGLGRFVNRSVDLYAKAVSPENEEITASNVPIARYFHGEPSDYSDKLDYYNYIDSATQVFKEAEETTGKERLEFMREFGSVARLEPLYKETQKQLRKLRKQKKQIEKTQKDPVKAYDQVQKIEAEMQRLFDQFNKRYREATR
jgi:hypothetical protein